MIGGSKGIGIGLDFGIGNQLRPINSGEYLDPTVKASLRGVWIADQNTNNSTYRNIIKNKLSNRGGDFEILNAAYKLNSGYGLYNYDYTTFNILADLCRVIDRTKVEYFAARGAVGFYNPKITSYKGRIKITGVTDAIARKEILYFQIYTNATDNNEAIKIYTDGEYDIDIKGIGTNVDRIYFYVVRNGQNAYTLTTPIYIEQVAEYQGAFVTDGVDDLIVSRKKFNEIINDSNEATIISMIHLLPNDVPVNIFTNYIRKSTKYSRMLIKDKDKTGIYGYSIVDNKASTINNILGDKNDYQLQTSASILSNDGVFSVAGYYENSLPREVIPVAWYWTFIADRVLTSFEIQQVIAYYNLDKYVNPSIYYDVKKQGITNENHAEFGDKLIDYSGNKRDLQLYNVGWGENSGISNDGTKLVLDGVNDYGIYTGDLGLKDYTFIMNRSIFRDQISSSGRLAKSGTESYTNTPFLFESYNTDGKLTNIYSYGSSFGFNRLNEDGWTYLSTYNYNGTVIPKGTGTGTGNGLIIGAEYSSSNFLPSAVSHVLLYPYSLNEFLIERQLKKLKAGTLYEDKVQFIPKVTANKPYANIRYFNASNGKQVYGGDYVSVGEEILVRIDTLTSKEYVSNITINGERPNDYSSSDGNFRYTYVVTKSINKIKITIGANIKFEDIVQPYPICFTFYNKETNKIYSWGAKIETGTIIKINKAANLFPELYAIDAYSYEGKVYSYKELLDKDFIASESLSFSVTKRYLLDSNPPKVIYSPQTLRLSNETYKILGYIPDLSGNGNHGVLNNFAYGGMSGANGYPTNFDEWRKYGFVISTYNKFTLDTEPTDSWLVFNTSGAVMPKFSVKITGIPDDGKLVYTLNAVQTQMVNGVNTIPATTLTHTSGFYITRMGDGKWKDLVIELLPDYEGCLIFDGVEDSVTLPTTTGGKQMFMKTSWDSRLGLFYDQRSNVDVFTFALYSSENNKPIAYASRNNGSTYLNGVLNKHINTLELQNIVHNITVTNNNVNDSNTTNPIIGTSKFGYGYTKLKLYTFMLFDEISTPEKIEELNDVIGIDNVIDPPPYYWDTYGKSNYDTDKYTLTNKGVGGDHNLEILNVAYDKMSGYGGYNFAKFTSNEWSKLADDNGIEYINISDYIVTLKRLGNVTWVFSNTIYKALHNSGVNLDKDLLFKIKSNKAISVRWDFKYRLVGDTSDKTIHLFNQPLTPNKEATLTLAHKTDDEINALGDITPNSVYYLLYFSNTNMSIGEEYTIEMLPIYPNALVVDGVSDRLVNDTVPAFTDYTIVAKRKHLAKEVNSCFAHKGYTATNNGAENAFIFEYRSSDNNVYQYSFGGNTKITIDDTTDIVSGTSKSYNDAVAHRGTGIDQAGIKLVDWSNNGWEGVFYKLVLYPNILDNLSIKQLKNLFEKDEIIDLNNPIFKK